MTAPSVLSHEQVSALRSVYATASVDQGVLDHYPAAREKTIETMIDVFTGEAETRAGIVPIREDLVLSEKVDEVRGRIDYTMVWFPLPRGVV